MFKFFNLFIENIKVVGTKASLCVAVGGLLRKWLIHPYCWLLLSTWDLISKINGSFVTSIYSGNYYWERVYLLLREKEKTNGIGQKEYSCYHFDFFTEFDDFYFFEFYFFSSAIFLFLYNFLAYFAAN